jgi:hypothetical protein
VQNLGEQIWISLEKLKAGRDAGSLIRSIKGLGLTDSTMAEAMVKAAVPGATESEVFVAGLYAVHIRGTAAPWMHMNPGPADVDEHQMYPRDDHKIHHHLHLFSSEISSSPFTKVNEILSGHTDSSTNSSRPCFNKRDTHEFSYEVGRWNPSYGFATVRKPLKTKLLYFKT